MQKKHIQYLILAITTECNLDCIYCYEGKKKSISMDKEIIKTILCHASSPQVPLHIQISGGEPTLKPNLIEYLCSYITKKDIHANIAIQTNGTLLDNSLINLFKKYNIKVGVSIDGPIEIQNITRGNANLTFKGLALLDKMGISFNVTTVISEFNINYLDKLIMSLSCFNTLHGIGLDILISKGNAIKNNVKLLDPIEFRRGIKKFLNVLYWINTKRTHKIVVREIESLKRTIITKQKQYFCFAQKETSMAITPEGHVYPCTQTMGDRNFYMGNILSKEDLHSPKVVLKSLMLSNKCKECRLKEICPGECPSRLFYNNHINWKLACIMYKEMSNYI